MSDQPNGGIIPLTSEEDTPPAFFTCDGDTPPRFLTRCRFEKLVQVFVVNE